MCVVAYSVKLGMVSILLTSKTKLYYRFFCAIAICPSDSCSCNYDISRVTNYRPPIPLSKKPKFFQSNWVFLGYFLMNVSVAYPSFYYTRWNKRYWYWCKWYIKTVWAIVLILPYFCGLHLFSTVWSAKL